MAFATVRINNGRFFGVQGSLVARGESMVRISGNPRLNGISLHDSAKAEITGGVIDDSLGIISANDSSTVNIRGGTFTGDLPPISGRSISARGNAQINIYGGMFERETILIRDNGEVHIYGTDLIYFTDHTLGFAGGTFLDGTPIALDFQVNDLSQHGQVILHEIPEPTTFLMLLGGIACSLACRQLRPSSLSSSVHSNFKTV